MRGPEYGNNVNISFGEGVNPAGSISATYIGNTLNTGAGRLGALILGYDLYTEYDKYQHLGGDKGYIDYMMSPNDAVESYKVLGKAGVDAGMGRLLTTGFGTPLAATYFALDTVFSLTGSSWEAEFNRQQTMYETKRAMGLSHSQATNFPIIKF